MGRNAAAVGILTVLVIVPAVLALIRDLRRPIRSRFRLAALGGIVVSCVGLMVVLIEGRLMCLGDEGDGCGGQPSYWIRLALLFAALTAGNGLALMLGPRRPSP